MQNEYCVLESAASNDYPMLTRDEYFVGLVRPRPVEPLGRPVKLRLGKPIPRNPLMVDFHELPEPVFSPRMKNALAPLGIHGVQFIPAEVRVKPDDVRPYWIMHVHNWIACIDRERSVVSFHEDGDVFSVQTLVLDERVLDAIPLEQRLAFCLADTPSTHVFHQSLVEQVLALKPEGLRFIPVSQWGDSAAFQP